MLRLHYHLHDGPGIPPLEELLPHFRHVRASELLSWKETRTACSAWQTLSLMAAPRFNLTTHDAVLLKAARHGHDVQTKHTAWAQYCKTLLVPMRFYAFVELHPIKYFFVGESKIIPGRDARMPGEAIGRPIALTWFEQCDDMGGDPLVKRVDDTKAEMQLQLLTLAELLRAAGCYIPSAAEDTARDVELRLEAEFMGFSLTTFRHERIESGEDNADPFVFRLDAPHWSRRGVVGIHAPGPVDEDGSGAQAAGGA